MTEIKHTELPWHYAYEGSGGHNVFDTEGEAIANCERGFDKADGEAEANAKFIVRACNAHDELVAACQWLYENILHDPAAACNDDAMAKIRASLAKATEEQP